MERDVSVGGLGIQDVEIGRVGKLGQLEMQKRVYGGKMGGMESNSGAGAGALYCLLRGRQLQMRENIPMLDRLLLR